MNESTQISKADYIKLCEELQSLVRAWNDRLNISEHAAAGVLLQIGGTMAAWGGTPLEQTLSYVEHAWKSADQVPS